MKKKKVAIQGIKGSFHHAAVSKYFNNKFGNYNIVEFTSFRKLVISVYNYYVDIGVMAIENTIAGSILSNYKLLSEYDLKIIGEIYLPIKHHLVGYSVQKIHEIHEIYSHPMALLQCESFIDKYPNIKISEYSDTASAARYISICKKNGIAAIASENAAIEYNLKIIYKNIQTISNNFTRFFVIKKYLNNNNIYFNKASIKIKILHTTGSLSSVLNIISKLNINMTKIQSIPNIEKPWEYIFYIDLVFEKTMLYNQMIEKISNLSYIHDFVIMGKYKNGIKSQYK